MTEKNKKTNKKEKVDEKGNITIISHILIRDKKSGEILVNKRA